MLSLKKGIIVDGRFRILGYLGSGGMGTVYQAEQIGLDRQVALKLLNSDLMHDRGSLARFEREAQVLSSINHPNVASFYAYGVWLDRTPYIAMQLLVGDNLSSHIASQGGMTWRSTLAIAAQIAGACAHLHDLGIVHRDLKPSNVFIVDVEGESRVTITDFGLARIVDTGASQKLTATGLMVGTPHYMAPELALGEQARPAADIYALGCMMYECLSGRPPFDADSSMEILYQHLNTAPRILPRIPDPVMSCILTAMAKDAPKRFASMREMADAIRELQKQTKDLKDSKAGHPVIRGSAMGRRRSWWQALSVVAIVSLVLLAALFMHGFVTGNVAQSMQGNSQQALPIARALASVGDWEDAEKFFDVAVSQPVNGPDGALKKLDLQLELMKLYQQQPLRQPALLSSILLTVPEAAKSRNFDAQEYSAHRIGAIADWLSLRPTAIDDKARSAAKALQVLIEHARGLGMTDPLYKLNEINCARVKAHNGQKSLEFQEAAWNAVNDLYYSDKSAHRERVCEVLNDLVGNGLPPVRTGVGGRIAWIWQNTTAADMYWQYDQKQSGARVLNLLLQHKMVENDPFWQAYVRMELARILDDKVQFKQRVYEAAAAAMRPSSKGQEEAAAQRRISDELANLKDFRAAAALMAAAKRDATRGADQYEFAWRYRDWTMQILDPRTKTVDRKLVRELLNEIVGEELPPVPADVPERGGWIRHNVICAQLCDKYDQKQRGIRVLNQLLKVEFVANDPFWKDYVRMELTKITGDKVELKQRVHEAASTAMKPSPKGPQQACAEFRIQDELADLKDYSTAAALMAAGARDATSEADRHEFERHQRGWEAKVKNPEKGSKL